MDIAPLMLPAREPTVVAGDAVTGGRFVKLKTGVNADNDQPKVTTCTLGAKPYAVAERDRLATERVKVYRNGRVPVTAGDVLTHGMRVMSDAQGRAIPWVGGGAAVAATLVTGTLGANNAILWTARDEGDAGNGISVTILGSTGNNVALAVAVVGNNITVTPATDGAGVVTSTAAQVMAAVAALAAANALVTTANSGASSGAGVPVAVAATELTGGDDDANQEPAGWCIADTANGALAPIDLELGA